MLNWFRAWIRDPFGRKRRNQVHDAILKDLVATTATARYVRTRHQFPISRSVGNPGLRNSTLRGKHNE